MKSTVINNSNSETPNQPHPEQQNVNANQANNGQANNDHSRRFPQFRQHGFGFDDPDAGVFADMGLRSRLNRMGNPFDWSARKRRGSGQGNADPYGHYFDDVDFPDFGSTWDAFGRMGNKRSQHPSEANDRSGFFNYVPPEFREHVPEHFGAYFNRHPQMHPQQQPQQKQQQPHHQQQHHQQQQHPQQQHPQQQHQQQPSNQQQQQPQQTGSKSNLCDAAIQTDDLDSQNNGNQNNDNSTNRSSSSASSSSSSTPYGNQVHMSTSTDGPGAYANAAAGNNQNQYYQQSPNYGAHQAPPTYGRQYQQPYGQQYQYSQSPQQNQYYTNQPQQQAPPPPPQQQQEGFVRNVPIFFEGSKTPVSTAPPAAQSGSNKARPEPLNKESFASNQPEPQQSQQQQHSDNNAPTNADEAPPQTPHTADCISKIQAIQRDVLELMLAVEQFGGKRGDKDYIYLDEMLTRNLLKLDTIDTNGKESIRLARKEAIKCIQTSIAVLEAKADLSLNENQSNADSSNKEQTADGGTETAAAAAAASGEKSAEQMDVQESNAASNNGTEQQQQKAADPTDAEIPQMQQNVENISIEDKPSNGNEKPPQNEQQTKPEDNATSDSADAKK